MITAWYENCGYRCTCYRPHSSTLQLLTSSAGFSHERSAYVQHAALLLGLGHRQAVPYRVQQIADRLLVRCVDRIMNTVESLLDGVKEHAPGAWESTGLAGYIRGTLTTRLLLQILVCSGRTRGDPGCVRSYNLDCEVYAVLASDVNGAFTWRRCPGVMRSPTILYIAHCDMQRDARTHGMH